MNKRPENLDDLRTLVEHGMSIPPGTGIKLLGRIVQLERLYDIAVIDAVRKAKLIEELEATLQQIIALPSHRNPCCPTNRPKQIASQKLREIRDAE